jgi:hypothetical protein
MVVMKRRDRHQFPDRQLEPLEVRRRRQQLEASDAVKEYLRAQKAARARMATLRKQRLAREAATVGMRSAEDGSEPHRSI